MNEHQLNEIHKEEDISEKITLEESLKIILEILSDHKKIFDNFNKKENFFCDVFHDFEKRIDKLEKENEIRKDTISCIDRAYDTECKELGKRISRLENLIKDNQGLISRIGILGTALHELSEENYKLKKTPHKCPVCDGKYIAIFKECESACLACDKGIVWG
jgi:DNA repair exonuclease SbcCD ATPase subunit